MKRGAPLKRRAPLRARKAKRPTAARCVSCKLGTVERPVKVEIEVRFSEEATDLFRVVVPRAGRCDACGKVVISREQLRKAEEEAYGRQRQEVFDRDRWTCQRCGRSGVPVQCAHREGKSRARNPGPEKHAKKNLEACCCLCHDAEHGGRSASLEAAFDASEGPGSRATR